MPTFSKNERLCSKLLIDKLFAQGHKFHCFPFSVRWMHCPEQSFEAPAQVMLVTPKRKLHHAVDRNRTRRLMRECYRANKLALYDTLEKDRKKIILSISYIHNEVVDYAMIQPKFDKMMALLKKQLEEQSPCETSFSTLSKE